MQLILKAQRRARGAGRSGARGEHAEHGAVRAADGGVSGVGAAARRAARGDRGGAPDVVVQVGRARNGEVIGLERFGASAPYEKIYEGLGHHRAAGDRRSETSVGMSRTACFFVEGVDEAALQRVEFYAQDVQILKDAGYEIDFVSKLQQLRPADLFFVWWWTWALAPITFAKALRRPVLVTGVLDINYYDTRPWWHQAGMRRAFALADANVFTSELEFRDLPRRFHVRNPSYVPLTVDDVAYSPNGTRSDNLVCTVGWLQQPNATRK